MRVAATLVLGLFLGFVGAMVQSYVLVVGDLRLPAGTLLVLAALIPVARACAWWQGSRWGASMFSIGWLVATLIMASTSASGDLVIGSGTRQMSYLVGGSMLLAAAAGFPLLPEDDTPATPVGEAAASDA